MNIDARKRLRDSQAYDLWQCGFAAHLGFQDEESFRASCPIPPADLDLRNGALPVLEYPGVSEEKLCEMRTHNDIGWFIGRGAKVTNRGPELTDPRWVSLRGDQPMTLRQLLLVEIFHGVSNAWRDQQGRAATLSRVNGMIPRLVVDEAGIQNGGKTVNVTY